MIKKIVMKNCAVYDGKGIEIADCKKVNYLYGENGSGKTTISEYLRRNGDRYHDCQVIWENEVEVKVYNRHFREENIKSNMKGIFTIGEDSIETREKIDSETKKRDEVIQENEKIRQNLDKENTEKKKCEDAFLSEIWDNVYKPNKDKFADVFSGYKNSKSKLRDEILKIHREKNDTQVLSISELEENYKTLFNKDLKECSTVQEVNVDEIRAVEEDPIWEKCIVGNKDIPIARFIDQFDNSDWVRKGMDYIGKGDICPFCHQKTIDETLRSELEQFFNTEYETDLKKVRQLSAKYETLTGSLLNNLDKIETNKFYLQTAQVDSETFSLWVKLLREHISSNLSIMSEKGNEPSRKIELKPIDIHAISDAIVNGNQKVNDYNLKVADKDREKERLIKNIWLCLAKEQEKRIDDYEKKINNFNRTIEEIKNSLRNIDIKKKDIEERISELNKSTTSTKPAVDNINQMLESCGFQNFRIAQSGDDMYQIQRSDGTLVDNSLSEGEETFLSLLYFLQLVDGDMDKTKANSKCVLVIDDPISSLDSVILYIVGTQIRKIIKDIGKDNSNVEQLFLFTHNAYFLRAVANGNKKKKNFEAYWIIRKKEEISVITSYGGECPVHDTNELLWSELKEDNDVPLISIQNSMRRIIENFFSMFGGMAKIREKVENSLPTAEEKIACQSLFDWLNEGSHSIPDELYLDPSAQTVDLYKKVFKQVFEVTGAISYYNNMMEIEEDKEED